MRALCGLLQDQGKILNTVHDMRLEGAVNLATGIQIAQLALKHRLVPPLHNPLSSKPLVPRHVWDIASEKLLKGRDGLPLKTEGFHPTGH